MQASAGNIYDEATVRRSGTLSAEAIRVPIQIGALYPYPPFQKMMLQLAALFALREQ
jgi:hypothetical protein